MFRILLPNKGLILSTVLSQVNCSIRTKNNCIYDKQFFVKVANERHEWCPLECHLIDDQALFPCEDCYHNTDNISMLENRTWHAVFYFPSWIKKPRFSSVTH